LTGGLHVPIYGEQCLIEAAVTFAQRGGQIRILSEEKIRSSHPLLSELRSCGGNVETRVMSEKVTQSTRFHFAVADAQYFRLEPDKSKLNAFAQFGEPGTGKILKIAFDRLYQSSTQYNQ
jgi:hypothetical protein